MSSWSRTTNSGILMSQGPDVWNSGRVMAVLPLPGRRLLAGSSDAGVWLVTAEGASATSVGDWTTRLFVALRSLRTADSWQASSVGSRCP